MATITWNWDMPTGTFKSNFLSKQMLEATTAETILTDDVEPVPGFGKKKGETVTIPREHVIAEPSSAVLSELTRIPEVGWQLSAVTITPSELGQSITHTNLLEMLSQFDMRNRIQRALMDQSRRVLDTIAATAFKSGKVIYIPTGIASGVFDTDGTASTTATANVNYFHIEVVRDYLYDTLKAPTYAGGDYRACGRTKAIRGLRRDPAFEEWHKYTNPEAKENFEVGRIENIRFKWTNHAEALAEVGTGSVLGEMVVYGRDAVFMAEVQPIELRLETNRGQDYGRLQGVAWYGVTGFSMPWSDTANSGEARVVRFGSA